MLRRLAGLPTLNFSVPEVLEGARMFDLKYFGLMWRQLLSGMYQLSIIYISFISSTPVQVGHCPKNSLGIYLPPEMS